VVCAGGLCPSTCSSDAQCGAAGYCAGTTCQAKRARGQSCTAARECSSGFCVDGFCCNAACGELCRSCAVAGSLGSCVPVPDGSDPRAVCTVEPASGCRQDGFCDGRGACRFHLPGTTCGSASCGAGIESPAPTCNGAGSCVPPVGRACGAYLCAGTLCGSTCITALQCAAGHACTGGRCLPLPAPALHWKLDDPAGATTAADASGNGRNGTYFGTSGLPASSALKPPVTFANVSSRLFDRESRHAIRLAPIPTAFKGGVDLTVSLWYLTSSLDTAGTDLLTAGDNFAVRLRPTGLAGLVRHTSGGANAYVLCQSTMSNHLDGTWHHAAVVFAATEVRVFVDGALVCNRALSSPVVYDRGVDLFAARHGNNEDNWDLEGNLDDVRIYTRALSGPEIAALAAGR
jgi:hypothetical protein